MHRLAGPNRFITSADAAQRLWFDGAETMTVATGLDYPDGLAGAAVAASADAPVVLATRDELPSAVRQTIIDRAPEQVLLIGGEAVLSSQLAQEIRDLPGSPEVDRIAGADRFATAQAAADAAGGIADGDVAVADGGGYADALAAGSLTAGDDPTPVVLASDDKVEADISQASRALLIGGPASVSPEAEADADAQTGVTRRLAGPTRWATSLQVADFTLTNQLTGDVPLVVATGEGFADGLSAGAIAARSGGPLLLIPTDGPTDAQARWIADHHQRLTGAWIVGGAEAISPAAVEQIDGLLDGRHHGSSGEPWDPDAEVRPDLMRLEPDEVAAGEHVEAFFPEETERGVGYVLERSVNDSWDARFCLTAGPDREDASWSSIEGGCVWEDVGRLGPGPDWLVIPEPAEPGPYRICTANAPENVCAEIQVTEPGNHGSSGAPAQDIDGPPPLAEGEVHRLAGPNRFITSADAAQRLWFDGAETMTVATGLDYPDGLAGAAVAASADAPVVLATRDELPSSVRQTIIDREPEQVRLLGGEAVLSSQLAQEIRDLPGSPEVDRIAGPDRFATAQAAAQAAGGVADGDVAVADGGGYADALAAGSLAAGDDPTPVVLASDDKVEADISPASRALLIGGPASLSPEAEADADAQTGVTRRLAGPTRWATSLQVADFTLTDRLTGDVPLVVATGEGFADGLSAGAIAARSGGPLLLIPTDGPTDAQARWIADHHQRLTGAWIVGGAEAISPAAVEQIDGLLDGRHHGSSGGPWDADAEVRPDLMRLEPDEVAAGEHVKAFFPEETERGVGYVLERSVNGSWDARFCLTAGPDPEDASWSSIEGGCVWEDVGRLGPGPDWLVIPEPAEPGPYRICTANAPENVCAEVQVTAPS